MSAASILVVDDNEDSLAGVCTVLEGEGHRVILAKNGADALTAFAAEAPDCVILDIRMSALDGFAVCARIRALPNGPETPIVFLTALRDLETFDRALRAGGDDFITKPVRATELAVRVRAALKLRQMSGELKEHYELLKHQTDALKRVQLQRERLMAFVVHDLKNPVNSMDLHAQVLLRDETLPAGLHESATHIRNEARHLTRMLLDLLDVSKAEEGKLSARLAEVDLAPLLEAVVGELSVLAAQRGVVLAPACAIVGCTIADETLLRRALTNLVENAIRHAPAKSTIRVTASMDAGGTLIRVIDSGPGIPVALRERVFDPFVRLDGGADDAPPSLAGRGLGLAFCKMAIDVQGGRIWVEDGAPGSIFCIRLPAVLTG